MKRIISLFCVVLLIFALTGCEKKQETNGGYVDVSADMNEDEQMIADMLKAAYDGFPLGLMESIVKEGNRDIANVIIREAEAVKNRTVSDICVKEICVYNDGKMYAVTVLYAGNAGYANDILIIENGEIVFQPLYDDDEQSNIIDTIDAFSKKTEALFNAINTKLNVSGEKTQTVLSCKKELIIMNDDNGERIKLPEEPVYEKDYPFDEPILPDYSGDMDSEEGDETPPEETQ